MFTVRLAAQGAGAAGAGAVGAGAVGAGAGAGAGAEAVHSSSSFPHLLSDGGGGGSSPLPSYLDDCFFRSLIGTLVHHFTFLFVFL